MSAMCWFRCNKRIESELMTKGFKSIFLTIVFANICFAQTTVTTNGGGVNNIPIFSGSATLSDSLITQANGYISIRGNTLGTTASSVTTLLNLFNGNNNVNNLNIVQIRTADGSTWDTATTRIQNVTDITAQGYIDFNPAGGQYGLAIGSGGSEFMRFASNGNIGIGTKDPTHSLTFGHTSTFNQNLSGNDNVFTTVSFRNTNDSGATFTDATIAAVQPTGYFADAGAITFSTSYGNLHEHMRIMPDGKVGIGTSTPGAMLDVAGSMKLSGGGASLSFPDGTTQSTAWNGTLCGGDYAESVDVSGDRKKYEPGDVLVIDSKARGKFLKSAEPYSTSVMGIYSTKPGLTGRRQLTAKSSDEVPMAMMGIVPTKVSTENGPILPGDLLVTSSTPGYAMKGTDRSRMLGALIGKALEGIDSGTGVIEVGVTLQ